MGETRYREEIIIPRGNLVERLRDCVSWCMRPENPTHPLDIQAKYRSNTLANYAKLFASENHIEDTPFTEETFDTFLAERKKRIKKTQFVPQKIIEQGLPSPKSILLCAYEQTVWCGSSEAASNFYVDSIDIPPWDTWVDLGKGTSGTKYLISWVHPEMIRCVDAAIEANPVDCLAWADLYDGQLVCVPSLTERNQTSVPDSTNPAEISITGFVKKMYGLRDGFCASVSLNFSKPFDSSKAVQIEVPVSADLYKEYTARCDAVQKECPEAMIAIPISGKLEFMLKQMLNF